MPITINGSGTLTGLSAGGLPDNCITAADLATTLDLSSNTVTLPSGTGGKILQVVQTVNTAVESTTSTSFVDIADMTATITPSSTSSKILILTDLSISLTSSLKLRMFRGTTEIYSGDTNGGSLDTVIFNTYSGGTSEGEIYHGYQPIGKTFLDSPATTSATTYKFQWLVSGGTGYLNRTAYDSGGYNGRAASSLTLLEIAA